ncbi:hypothetical protein QOZ80_4AG0312180 [Eleusine coracana subsp. coracana]|nr:hypothetical protein QOZ80_4AG0312180 [Eleusine coracana subsp. coracana]
MGLQTLLAPPPPHSIYAFNSAAATGGNTLREQILLQPDVYIGPAKKRTQKVWVSEGIYMKERVATYVPGLHQIFDEILVYAAENKQQDPTMDTLRVDVDIAKCHISVYNSGKGIPIEVRREEGIYVPEMIFCRLSKCDHEEEITDGRNSYGVKLANIFSTEFVVEIADGPGQKKYKQVKRFCCLLSFLK